MEDEVHLGYISWSSFRHTMQALLVVETQLLKPERLFHARPSSRREIRSSASAYSFAWGKGILGKGILVSSKCKMNRISDERMKGMNADSALLLLCCRLLSL